MDSQAGLAGWLVIHRSYRKEKGWVLLLFFSFFLAFLPVKRCPRFLGVRSSEKRNYMVMHGSWMAMYDMHTHMRCKVPEQSCTLGEKLKWKRWTDMVYRETGSCMRPAAESSWTRGAPLRMSLFLWHACHITSDRWLSSCSFFLYMGGRSKGHGVGGSFRSSFHCKAAP